MGEEEERRRMEGGRKKEEEEKGGRNREEGTGTESGEVKKRNRRGLEYNCELMMIMVMIIAMVNEGFDGDGMLIWR